MSLGAFHYVLTARWRMLIRSSSQSFFEEKEGGLEEEREMRLNHLFQTGWCDSYRFRRVSLAQVRAWGRSLSPAASQCLAVAVCSQRLLGCSRQPLAFAGAPSCQGPSVIASRRLLQPLLLRRSVLPRWRMRSAMLRRNLLLIRTPSPRRETGTLESTCSPGSSSHWWP